MVKQICNNNNNNDDFGYLHKPKPRHLSIFRRRKAACQSKAPKRIVIKKKRNSDSIISISSNDDHHDLKKRNSDSIISISSDDDDDLKKRNSDSIISISSDDDDDDLKKRNSDSIISISSDDDDDHHQLKKRNSDSIISISSDDDDDHLKKRRLVYRRDLIPDCVSVDEYKSLGEISAGTFGIVYKVEHKKTGQIMAMKEEKDGLCAATKMEIDILKSLGPHPCIVGFKEVAVDGCDGVYVIMEYMHTDLKRYIGLNQEIQVKKLMKQLLRGVKFLHENGVMHRDLKPSNVLVNESGELKICDFGASTWFGEELGSYSPRVGTLWYRAPELLLGEMRYSCAVDMWAVGCIMAEMVLKEVLFMGESEEDQLHEIYRILGHPSAKNHCSSISSAKFMFSEAEFDLLKGLLSYDPSKRITAEAALNHVWFQELD